MQINRERFFAGYREEFGRLSQSQVSAINDLLDFIETDEEMQDSRHISYVLATIKHETANTFLPIEEYGKGRGRKYGIADKETGQKYYGRGFVQLTWRKNYETFARLLDVDLVNEPALSMEPQTAWRITSIGMRRGLFTGKKLSDYISDKKTDYVGARKIINGTDKAQLIAGYAETFESLVKGSEVPGATPGSVLVTDSQPSSPSQAASNAPGRATHFDAPTTQSLPGPLNPLPAAPEQPQQTVESGGAATQVVVQPNALDNKAPVSSPFDEPIKVLKGKAGNLLNYFSGAGVLGGVWAFTKDNPWLVVFFVTLIFLTVLTIVLVNHHKKVIEARTAANPDLYKVQFVKEAKS